MLVKTFSHISSDNTLSSDDVTISPLSKLVDVK